MRPELEDIKTLEDYLQGGLSEDARENISIRLLWDEIWQHNLVAQQNAYKALQFAGRQHIRIELDAIHSRLFG